MGGDEFCLVASKDPVKLGGQIGFYLTCQL